MPAAPVSALDALADLATSPPAAVPLKPIQMLRMQLFQVKIGEDMVAAASKYIYALNQQFTSLVQLNPEIGKFFTTKGPFNKAREAYESLPDGITTNVPFLLFLFLCPQANSLENFELKDLGEFQLPFTLAAVNNLQPPHKKRRLC